jgi:hypothetical protein
MAPQDDHPLVLERRDFVRVVDEASARITASTRAKLLAVAETTDAVAIAASHHDGVDCLASQAGRRNRKFEQEFDRAVAVKFGRLGVIYPFVVQIEGEGAA